MNPSKHFPLLITEDLAATRAYYIETLGCAVSIDLEGYVQLRFGEDLQSPEIAFSTPESMASSPDPSSFGGQGLFLSVPVPDADAHCERLRARGAEIGAELSDKPWGWRSFAVRDPNGLWLDFFHEAPQTGAADAAS